MTNKPNNIPTSVAGQPGRLPPVRVKMCRTGAFVEKVYPPDGDSKNWWQRLNKALGTASSDFVNASLLQIQAAARSPFGTISETAMNAALAMIAGARPKDEIEGALTVQMAFTHTAAMPCSASSTVASDRSDELRRTHRLRVVCSERM
jgi:hypothetical protein